MRAIIISKWFPTPYIPNSGVFVLEQIKALRRQGIDVGLVITPTPWAPRCLSFLARFRKYQCIPLRSEQEGFKVEHPRVLNLPGDRLFFLYGLFFYLRCRKILRKLLKEQEIDLIHAHTSMPEGFASVLLGREFRLPVVCTLHGGDINDVLPPFMLRSKKRLALAAVRWALRNLKHLIAVSQDLRLKAQSLRGDCGIDITVARNGADRDVFRPISKIEARKVLGLPQECWIFVFIGGLVTDKGVPFLLEAFARIRRPDTALYLVGGGRKERELRNQCRSLCMEAACIFVGPRPHAEVPLWLSAGDCFVLSSLTEGSPTILSEAMLCRIPIVATRVGGVPELIHDGETGLVVPSQDAAALARGMEFIMNDRNAAEQMAAKAETYAKEHLTWDANARRTIEVYRAATERNHAYDIRVEAECLKSS
jgi:teichuronic acid biosynthesis glycosyltransferase TuaC